MIGGAIDDEMNVTIVLDRSTITSSTTQSVDTEFLEVRLEEVNTCVNDGNSDESERQQNSQMTNEINDTETERRNKKK